MRPFPRLALAAAFTATLSAAAALGGCSSDRVSTEVRLPEAEGLERGRMIVTTVAACGFCHGTKPKPDSTMSGGRRMKDRYGELYATNITPDPATGIGAWSVTEFIRALRSHVGPKERELSTQVHAGYAWMADADMLAVAAYVRSLRPARVEIEKRGISFMSKNTTGFLESRIEMEGYVPPVDPKYTKEYGRYLVDHVAQCGTCHDGSPTLFGSGPYLAGGRTIWIEEQETKAPNLTQSKTVGIGGWGESGIRKFLDTGTTPANKRVNRHFCPIDFYSLAPETEKQAMARYLSSVPPSE